MIVVYKVIEHQTHMVQVEIAHLSRAEWVIHERGRLTKRSRTAVTIASATERLRENSVYLDPRYVPASIRRIADARRRARAF